MAVTLNGNPDFTRFTFRGVDMEKVTLNGTTVFEISKEHVDIGYKSTFNLPLVENNDPGFDMLYPGLTVDDMSDKDIDIGMTIEAKANRLRINEIKLLYLFSTKAKRDAYVVKFDLKRLRPFNLSMSGGISSYDRGGVKTVVDIPKFTAQNGIYSGETGRNIKLKPTDTSTTVCYGVEFWWSTGVLTDDLHIELLKIYNTAVINGKNTSTDPGVTETELGFIIDIDLNK